MAWVAVSTFVSLKESRLGPPHLKSNDDLQIAWYLSFSTQGNLLYGERGHLFFSLMHTDCHVFCMTNADTENLTKRRVVLWLGREVKITCLLPRAFGKNGNLLFLVPFLKSKCCKCADICANATRTLAVLSLRPGTEEECFLVTQSCLMISDLSQTALPNYFWLISVCFIGMTCQYVNVAKVYRERKYWIKEKKNTRQMWFECKVVL